MRLIDADSFLKHLEEPTKYGYSLIDKIINEPTVDAVPVVHAHWIKNPNGMDYGLPAWTCSNCGGRNDMIPVMVPMKGKNYEITEPTAFGGSSYCPYCGAKMDDDEAKEYLKWV